ncbi:KAP family P-loop NTPase fold protein [Streptomyces nymphaeiformis]|uniref:KAP NTPase domain-containing protein n=1 Tax=Streptomyces nymphaeiformis TaxID=2663842 RepID=A0A7W7U154_9ACTN|nr:P-loop NTPase fold protein [Streptomyces nymphaeiformis]MBB4983031.1 hypothetical protein [Streptomyces nymphaeiformis]
MSQRSYFRDDPDPANDSLERRSFAQSVVGALAQVRQQSKSSVAGLIGPWGSGKSTTLSMVLDGLKDGQDVDWTVVELNPWLYSDTESLQLGFFVALREALPDGSKWSQGRERIGNFFTAISPAGKVNGIAGVDASAALESVGKWIAGDVSANGMKARAEKVLEDLEKPIMFVLDDLDRLTPEELLMVFKLVRLVGRLPNIYYLLAYDEKTLLDLIQQTDVAAGDRLRARDYMEKIVQVRFDMPPMRPKQTLALLDSALTELMERYGVVMDEQDVIRFSATYQDLISGYLTTPRAVNRYIAQIDSLFDSLNDEVNFVEFCLLTFLRTFEPEVYKKIPGSWRAELLGEDVGRMLRQRSGENAQEEARWLKELSEAGAADARTQSIFDLLSSLFPALEMIKKNYSGGLGSLQDKAERRLGVGHRDYFDRYFSFGVPGDDVPNRTVRGWLVRLGEGPDESVAAELEASLFEDTVRIARKIEARISEFPDAACLILPIAADIRSRVVHQSFSIVGSPMLAVERLARVAMEAVPSDRAHAVILEMDSYEYGAILVSEVLEDLRLTGDEGKITPVEPAVVEVLHRRVEGFISRDLKDVSDHDFRHVFHWRRAAGKEVVDPILREALIGGPWDALEFAALNVSVAISGSGESLSDLRIDFLEEVVGLDYFYENLSSELDGFEESVPDHLPVTRENRRKVALARLKYRRGPRD